MQCLQGLKVFVNNTIKCTTFLTTRLSVLMGRFNAPCINSTYINVLLLYYSLLIDINYINF